MLTPTEKAAKWANGVEFSVDTAQASVNALLVSPATQAIAQKATMRANWIASVDDGTWEAKLQPFTDINIWRPRMIAGLERNRNITVGQQTKMSEHFSLQDHVVGLYPSIVALIQAGSNGVTAPAGMNATVLTIITNIVVNKHINAFDLGSTDAEVLAIIIPSLISDFGFT